VNATHLHLVLDHLLVIGTVRRPAAPATLGSAWEPGSPATR
jgi:hypothetical protein